MRALLPAVLLLVSSISCVHEGGPEQPVPVGTTVVAVSFSTAPEELPFNPRGARLVSAGQQIERALEHPIQIQIDAALLPQWRENFENALTTSLENVAKDLAWLRGAQPRMDAFARPRLARIGCRYDSAARFATFDFDPATGTLSIDTPAPPPARASTQPHAPEGTIVPQGALVDAIPRAYYRFLEQRLLDTPPERAPAGELAAYWDYVTRHHNGSYPLSAEERGARLADHPEAIAIELAVRFSARVPEGTALAGGVEKRLAEWSRWFGYAYMTRAEEVEQARPGSAFRRAEAAYAGWLRANITRLSPEEQQEIIRESLFGKRIERGRELDTSRTIAGAFPGFDAFGYALGVLDAWRASGHPAGLKAVAADPLLRAIVCPAWRDDLGRRSVAQGCQSQVYGWALALPDARRRLLDAVVSRRDPALTETVIQNLVHLGDSRSGEVLDFWRSLEGHPAEWSVATAVIADAAMEGAGTDPSEAALYDEGLRLWHAYPDRRGLVLYLLRALEPYNMIRDGLVHWTEFDRVFGAKIGASEYAAYVRQGPLAIGRLAGLWKALGTGYSRAEPLIPMLDAYFEDTRLKAYDLRAPNGPLDDVLSRLCADHAEEDLALLHAYFQKRAAGSPSEERRLGLLLEVTSPGRCGAARRPRGRR